MARQASATDSRSFLPKELVQAMFRRLVELAGLIFIVAGVVLALSLISYNPDDPSASTATTAAATNWLGDTGAYIADLLLQTLGLASVFLIIALWCWGGRLIAHMGLYDFWRYAALLPLSLLAWSAGFAGVPAWPTWPVGSGLGGFIGLTLERELTGLVALAGVSLPGWVMPLVLIVIAVTLWVPSTGVSYKGWGKGLYALTWPLRAPVAWVLRKEEPGQLPAPEQKLGFFQRFKFRGKLKERDRRWTGRSPSKPHPEPKPAPKPPPVETAKKAVPSGKRAEREKQPTLDLEPKSDTELPPLALLAEPPRSAGTQINEDALQQNARLLESVLDDFGVRGEIVKVHPGPVVTLYELEPAPGTKSSRVIGLADDIARSMSAVSARVAVVPGRNAIGIELPNAERETVTLREMLAARSFEKNAGLLPLALGKDIGGSPVVVDLASMPHLLIAGTTGSGKSVAVNTMILSLLYRLPPSDCRFIMIDPKMLELSVYDGIPHLLSPVVTDPKKAVVALKWAVREMEDRYKAMSKLGVRNLSAYNERLAEARKTGEVLTRRVQTGFDQDTGQPTYEEQELDLDPL
ncbi:MAG: DNA translocase FtsK 4TM domain-containing protein, partial [Alphaproteobacteria bacterium]|nr:DNA translocase FtsK 4TM domain-containing protein [Alphaproteobacteria bacterium]